MNLNLNSVYKYEFTCDSYLVYKNYDYIILSL